MTERATSVGRRARGRPPRLSREQIVQAAVEVLEQEPSVSLTIKRVADAVGSAPMALYRYFPDRDALLQAAADQVLDDMGRAPLPDGTWQDRLRAWMRTVQERLRPYPQLVPYLLSTRQPTRLLPLVEFHDILAPVGLDWEDFALAIALANATLIGYVVYESRRRPVEETAALFREALDARPPEQVEAGLAFVAALPGAYARLHDTIVDQVIATVERLAARSGQDERVLPGLPVRPAPPAVFPWTDR
jgi:AcrR family transcriptional regulator